MIQLRSSSKSLRMTKSNELPETRKFLSKERRNKNYITSKCMVPLIQRTSLALRENDRVQKTQEIRFNRTLKQIKDKINGWSRFLMIVKSLRTIKRYSQLIKALRENKILLWFKKTQPYNKRLILAIKSQLGQDN